MPCSACSGSCFLDLENPFRVQSREVSLIVSHVHKGPNRQVPLCTQLSHPIKSHSSIPQSDWSDQAQELIQNLRQSEYFDFFFPLTQNCKTFLRHYSDCLRPSNLHHCVKYSEDQYPNKEWNTFFPKDSNLHTLEEVFGINVASTLSLLLLSLIWLQEPSVVKTNKLDLVTVSFSSHVLLPLILGILGHSEKVTCAPQHTTFGIKFSVLRVCYGTKTMLASYNLMRDFCFSLLSESVSDVKVLLYSGKWFGST